MHGEGRYLYCPVVIDSVGWGGPGRATIILMIDEVSENLVLDCKSVGPDILPVFASAVPRSRDCIKRRSAGRDVSGFKADDLKIFQNAPPLRIRRYEAVSWFERYQHLATALTNEDY